MDLTFNKPTSQLRPVYDSRVTDLYFKCCTVRLRDYTCYYFDLFILYVYCHLQVFT